MPKSLSRFVFLTFVFGYLWFYLRFIERYIYILYLCVNKYFNMRKVWIPHCPFLIDKMSSRTFPIFFFWNYNSNRQPYQWKNFKIVSWTYFWELKNHKNHKNNSCHNQLPGRYTPKVKWFVPKCKSTFKKFPSYMESFIFVFCLNFQVK